jgi:hypothetical protein
MLKRGHGRSTARRIHSSRRGTHTPGSRTNADGVDPHLHVLDRFWIHDLPDFQYLATKEQLREPIVSPQVFGVPMILVGLTALALAWIQHRQQIKALKADFGTMPYSIAGIMAGFIAGLGLIALIG